jgi:hypothetical protein
VEFTLYYQGQLLATSNKDRRRSYKHYLRQRFHKRLKQLWAQEPLNALRRALELDGLRF